MSDYIKDKDTLKVFNEMKDRNEESVLKHMKGDSKWLGMFGCGDKRYYKEATPFETLVHIVDSHDRFKKKNDETRSLAGFILDRPHWMTEYFLYSALCSGMWTLADKTFKPDSSDHLEEAHASCNTTAKPKIARCVENFMNTNYSGKTKDYKGLSEIFFNGTDGSTIRLKINSKLSCTNDAEGDVSCAEKLHFAAETPAP